MQRKIDVYIENTPKAVMDYVADINNRPLFLPSLKSIELIEGEAKSKPGTKWRWTWVLMGIEFEGTASCLKHEPGKLYSFKTDGGLESTWTYRAEPKGEGTQLNVTVDYTVPEKALARMKANLLDSVTKKEAETTAENLKMILDQ